MAQEIPGSSNWRQSSTETDRCLAIGRGHGELSKIKVGFRTSDLVNKTDRDDMVKALVETRMLC